MPEKPGGPEPNDGIQGELISPEDAGAPPPEKPVDPNRRATQIRMARHKGDVLTGMAEEVERFWRERGERPPAPERELTAHEDIGYTEPSNFGKQYTADRAKEKHVPEARAGLAEAERRRNNQGPVVAGPRPEDPHAVPRHAPYRPGLAQQQLDEARGGAADVGEEAREQPPLARRELGPADEARQAMTDAIAAGQQPRAAPAAGEPPKETPSKHTPEKREEARRQVHEAGRLDPFRDVFEAPPAVTYEAGEISPEHGRIIAEEQRRAAEEPDPPHEED